MVEFLIKLLLVARSKLKSRARIFVGRQREMDAMKAAAERAKSGHGQAVGATRAIEFNQIANE